MSNRSIRFRLTLWYTLAFSVAAIVIFTSFYFITRYSFFIQTDNALSSHTQSIVNLVKRQEYPMHQMMIKEVFLSEYAESPGMLVVIMDENGNIAESSIPINQTNLVFSQLFDDSQKVKHALYKDQYFSGIPMRFFIQPVYDGQSLRAVVLMAHPMDIIQKSLKNLLFTLIGVFFVFLAPTIIGGYFLAKSGLQPIADTSRKIKEITSENLNERLPNPKTHDEIEELTMTFNDLLNRLHKAFTRERQFIGDVAHEMKTPLATQRSQIEVTLSKDRSKDDYKKTLSEMLIDNENMGNTIKNILDLAWSEADSSKKIGEVFSLSHLLTELKDVADKMAFQKQIIVEDQIEQDIYIVGKQDKLGHAILCLLDNAIKYTPEKGKINLQLKKKGDRTILKIRDTGIGIKEKDLPHIFERFYRGSKTDRTVGSGLGLAIAQSIIHVFRGTVDVSSKVNKGTTVTVSLPLVKKNRRKS